MQQKTNNNLRRSNSTNEDVVVVEDEHDNYTDYVSRPLLVDKAFTSLSHEGQCDSSPEGINVELSSLLRPKSEALENNTFGTERRLTYGDDDDNDTYQSPPRSDNNGTASASMPYSFQHSKSQSRDSSSSSHSPSDGTPKTKHRKSSSFPSGGIMGERIAALGKPKQPQPRRASPLQLQTPSRSMFLPPGSTTLATSLIGTPDLSMMMMGSIPEEQASDEENEDPIMEAMDKIEDEIDGHAYDELIPLQIRMALEDQIFGWDHFLSNILGHVGFTVGSYLITFWIISYIVLREVPWKHYASSTGEEESLQSRSMPFGMSHEFFSFVRTALSLASAVSTFRTIRRRRRVWLRQPYGSVEYLAGREAQRRTASLEEADQRARRFVLGSKLWTKMQRSYLRRRERYLTRGVNKKLMKAQRMFERRHRNRVKLIRSTSNSSLIASSYSDEKRSSRRKRPVASALVRHSHEDSHHERVRMLAESGSKMSATESHVTSGDEDAGEVGSIGGSSVGTLSFEESGYQSFRMGYRDSHTLPNFAMESVSHDQMPFAHGEIKSIPYVHGGFFGAAPFMLTNPHWISILRILMPDVYVEISKRASYAPAPKLIHWAENNPVVAAFGTAHELEFSGRVPTLEWDVFLDPYLVKRVEIVLHEKEAFLQRQKDARKKKTHSNESETNNNEDEKSIDVKESDDDREGNNNDDEVMGNSAPPMASSNERLVLSYYNAEIRRRTELLAERMLIAHGNVAQLMLEQTGYLKKYNFSRVKRTRKTLGGGIYARQWLAVYAEAMKLGMGVEDDDYDDYDYDSETDSIGAHDDLNFSNENDVGGLHENNSVHSQPEAFSPDAKSVANSSVEAGVFRTPADDRSAGPPRKIVMMRSNDEDDDDDISTDGSTTSESSPQKSARLRKRIVSKQKRSARRKPPRRVDTTSLNALAKSICPDTPIAESIAALKPIMQCAAPFGLVLDMKSRHVSRRVWALVIDFLRDAGARVEGIASFFVDEVRDISRYCSSSVNEIVFAHSAGDMQLGCHDGRIKRGDRVFFNAGSLLWDYPNLYDIDDIKNIVGHRMQICFDVEDIKQSYRLKPYAKTTQPMQFSPKSQNIPDDESETCAESMDDGASLESDLFTKLIVADRRQKSLSITDFMYEEAPGGVCSTIQEYKNHYQLKIGLYVQEFAVDDAAISLIVKYVNANPHVFDLGLSWGGINGLTVRGIQPGRFTATDGLWNQRYGGMPWKKELKPSDTLPTS